MAFNAANLTISDYVAFDTDEGRIWDYTTSDTISSVESGTYFNILEATKMLRKADWLRVTASDGKGIYFVVSSIHTTPEVNVDKQASVSNFA